jgi:hypothetical protein
METETAISFVVVADRDSKNRKKTMEIEMYIVVDRVYGVSFIDLKKKNFFFSMVVVVGDRDSSRR